ncbi:RHS repeat-associated core domain-containing protein [Nocardia sp. FBN12]|uniref:RHS repeat-associated core domain-containing protein n=1 Tax=Nocardia sp. FBN12 TaxID=3419766 RepID=UPI003D06CC6B
MEGREYHNNLLVRDGRNHYYYDPAGWLIRKVTTRISRKPAVWHYRYNAFDQLTDVYTPEGEWWCYNYDAHARRVGKARLDTTTQEVIQQTSYVYEATCLIEESQKDSVTCWHYIPGTLTPAAQSVKQMSVAVSSIVVTDLTGCPDELINPHTAERQGMSKRTLWGRNLWTGATSTPLRYHGQYEDAESSLHHNSFRTYDPETGRFLTADPLGLAPAPNPHSYPHNPTKWSDPLGLTPEYREFAHGTSLDNANNIVNNGLDANAGQAATHGGLMSRPGSFFTHEVAGGDSPGFQSAYEWGLRVDPNSPSTVIVGRIPENVYQQLLERGHVEVRAVGEGVPDETIFHPRSFETLNATLEWIAKVTP